MTRSYKILRALFMVLVTLAIVIPMFLYVALSLPVFQRQLVTVAQRELTQLLGSRVEIGTLSVAPFNRVLLRDIAISDYASNDTILKVNRLGAGINLYQLVRRGKIIINYAEIVGLDADISRDSINAPLNIQPIIDRFKPKDERPSAPFSMAISTVLMRNCRLSYNVDNMPHPAPGVFSPHHVVITDLSSDFLLPRVGNNGGRVVIKRLRIRERSGLEISSLSGIARWQPGEVSWQDIDLAMPRSQLLASNGRWSDTISVTLDNGSYLNPIDLAPLAPVLSQFTEPVNLTTAVNGSFRDNLAVNITTRTPSGSVDLSLQALVQSPLDSAMREITDLTGDIELHPSAFLPLMQNASPAIKQIVENLGTTNIALTGSGNMKQAKADAKITTSQGNIKITGSASEIARNALDYKASIDINDLKLGNLLNRPELDKLSMIVASHGIIKGNRPTGILTLNVDNFDFNGHSLGQIEAVMEAHGNYFDLSVDSHDPAAKFNIIAAGDILSKDKELKIDALVDCFDFGELFPDSKMGNRVARINLKTNLTGNGIDDINGTIDISDIKISEPSGKDFALNSIHLDSSIGENGFRTINLNSEILDGTV
ncbi:MAG: hypothetical protein HDT01_05230, partial [Bacteroidales bacterium]|nr:hypothetical protein [Bacteroidales bacterium]